MKNNYIVLVDDEEKFKEEFKSKIAELGIKHELLYFKDVAGLVDALTKIDPSEIKFIIFDLCTSKGETESKIFKVDPQIDSFYKNHRIIIFIHSAYLHNYEKYPNEGTLYKIDKDAKSINNICQIIKTFEDSNFQNIFSQKGILETDFMTQIHEAFRSQFKANEIVTIINSIRESSKGGDPSKRVLEVFTRIAVKSLYHNLYSETSISPEGSSIEDISINAIENYYIRTAKYKYWTGDIFKSKKTDEYIIILNPRCNISNNKIEHLIFCKIHPFSPEQLKAFLKEENVRKGLTDDVKFSIIGDRFRFLPKTPKFSGGLIDFNTLSSLLPEEFLKKYDLQISISDDLTNDIIRKCSSYLVRGGVYINESKEALYYLKDVIEDKK